MVYYYGLEGGSYGVIKLQHLGVCSMIKHAKPHTRCKIAKKSRSIIGALWSPDSDLFLLDSPPVSHQNVLMGFQCHQTAVSPSIAFGFYTIPATTNLLRAPLYFDWPCYAWINHCLGIIQDNFLMCPRLCCFVAVLG